VGVFPCRGLVAPCQRTAGSIKGLSLRCQAPARLVRSVTIVMSSRPGRTEASALTVTARGLSVESAFQMGRGRALDDDVYLDDVMAETLSVQISREFDYRAAFAQVRTAFFAQDTRPGPTERVVPGYTIVDAAAGISIIPGLELRLIGRNLLNATYLASQDVRAVLGAGRAVAISAAITVDAR
jgi:outer membrane receptor protein involved in Fe transport